MNPYSTARSSLSWLIQFHTEQEALSKIWMDKGLWVHCCYICNKQYMSVWDCTKAKMDGTHKKGCHVKKKRRKKERGSRLVSAVQGSKLFIKLWNLETQKKFLVGWGGHTILLCKNTSFHVTTWMMRVWCLCSESETYQFLVEASSRVDVLHHLRPTQKHTHTFQILWCVWCTVSISSTC